METSVDTGTQFRLFSTAVVILCSFLARPVGKTGRKYKLCSFPDFGLSLEAAPRSLPCTGEKGSTSPKSGLAQEPQTRDKGSISPKPVLSHSPKYWLKTPPAAAFCPVQGTKTPSTAHLPGSHFHFQQQSTTNPRFVLPLPPSYFIAGIQTSASILCKR